MGNIYENVGHPIHVMLPVRALIPDEQLRNRGTGLFYLITGAFVAVAQTSLDDLHEMLHDRPELYRHQLKHSIKTACNCAETLIGVYKKYLEKLHLYEVWLDLLDAVEDNVKADFQKLFFTVDNTMLKHGVEHHRIATQTFIALNLCDRLFHLVGNFDDTLFHGGFPRLSLRPNAEFVSMAKGMATAARDVADIVLRPVRDVDFDKEEELIVRAFSVLTFKLIDIDFICGCLGEAFALHGLDLQREDSEAVNSYKPWDGIQLNFLKHNYGQCPDEEIASALGRSVGAIKVRARYLGLKKKSDINVIVNE